MRQIAGLGELAGAYDVLFCDVWGVIHNGATAFPAACEALSRWRDGVGPVILISNSPRPCRDVASQLGELGASPNAWNAIVTSGDATRALLRERAPGPAHRIGPSRDEQLFDGLGLRFGEVDTATFIACSGLVQDETETPEDYRQVLTRGAERGLTMVCANPDIVVQRGSHLIFCAGALAALYAELGGAVVMAGKPFEPIYAMAAAAAALALGRPAKRSRILAIGDGLATDIEGAQRQGLDALFIAAGIHGGELVTHAGDLRLSAAAALLAQANLTAAYAMADLIW